MVILSTKTGGGVGVSTSLYGGFQSSCTTAVDSCLNLSDGDRDGYC